MAWMYLQELFYINIIQNREFIELYCLSAFMKGNKNFLLCVKIPWFEGMKLGVTTVVLQEKSIKHCHHCIFSECAGGAYLWIRQRTAFPFFLITTLLHELARHLLEVLTLHTRGLYCQTNDGDGEVKRQRPQASPASRSAMWPAGTGSSASLWSLINEKLGTLFFVKV